MNPPVFPEYHHHPQVSEFKEGNRRVGARTPNPPPRTRRKNKAKNRKKEQKKKKNKEKELDENRMRFNCGNKRWGEMPTHKSRE